MLVYFTDLGLVTPPHRHRGHRHTRKNRNAVNEQLLTHHAKIKEAVKNAILKEIPNAQFGKFYLYSSLIGKDVAAINVDNFQYAKIMTALYTRTILKQKLRFIISDIVMLHKHDNKHEMREAKTSLPTIIEIDGCNQ